MSAPIASGNFIRAKDLESAIEQELRGLQRRRRRRPCGASGPATPYLAAIADSAVATISRTADPGRVPCSEGARADPRRRLPVEPVAGPHPERGVEGFDVGGRAVGPVRPWRMRLGGKPADEIVFA